MPADQPFVPIIASGVAGKTVVVTVTITTSTNGTLTSSVSAMAENVLVTNPNNVTIFIRMDDSTATPTATATDTPIPPNSARLFGNPNPVGTVGLATIGSVFGSGSGVVYFTPGNSGVV